MTIRRKTSLFMLCMIIVVVAMMYLLLHAFFARSFTKLEKDNSQRNVQRVTDALNNNIDQLSTKLSDWANWDDTYKFVGDKNQAFISSNLQNTSLKNLKINYMLFYNNKQQLVATKGIDVESGADKNIPADLLQKLSPESSLLQFTAEQEEKKGIIMLQDGPLILTARPILNSDATGPARGVLIFAQYLQPQVKPLADITHLSLAFYPYSSDNATPSDVVAMRSKLATHPLQVQAPNTRQIFGYGLVPDIFGQPALIVRVEQARSIYQQGQTATSYFVASFAAAAVAACLITILFFDRTVVNRIAHLSKQVAAIDKTDEHLVQVSVNGHDEIVSLGDSINGLLKRIYESRDLEQRNIKLNEKITEATKELEKERESLNRQLAESQRMNQIMVNRELKMIELKKRLAKHEPPVSPSEDNS